MLKQLEQNGFAVVPEVISGTTCDHLIGAIETALKNNGGNHAMRNLAKNVPTARELAESKSIRSLTRSILGENAFLVRSLFFDKTPEANWKVAWHQDLTIAVQEKIETPGFGPWSIKDGVLHVQPTVRVLENMLTIRVHLDECDLENGPLQVLRGSHGKGKLNAQEIDTWRGSGESVACVAPKGGVLLMRPLLLHASSSARAPRHRRVVHFEFAAEKLSGGLRWVTQRRRFNLLRLT
jgi:ectoine hydroxylase-related dioxygenase (phytanoyl-CoA dioxygenase family)